MCACMFMFLRMLSGSGVACGPFDCNGPGHERFAWVGMFDCSPLEMRCLGKEHPSRDLHQRHHHCGLDFRGFPVLLLIT